MEHSKLQMYANGERLSDLIVIKLNDEEYMEVDAELIVTAVNSHAELLAFVEKELDWLLHVKGQTYDCAPKSVLLGFGQGIKAAQALIKKVKGN